MFKTIKVKKKMNFRELMAHITQNDLTGYFKNDDGYGFDVNTRSHCFLFDKNFVYGFTETYDVEEIFARVDGKLQKIWECE